MDYTLRISGDFEKGECGKCPILWHGSKFGVDCNRAFGDCPLEEATVAKNATTEGEWIDKLIAELEEELELADREKQRCASRNPLQFDSAKGYAHGIANALDMLKNAYEKMKGGA